MSKAILQKHQTLVDFVIQYTGNADALFDLCELNDLELTEQPAPGTELILPDVIDRAVVRYLNYGKHKITTGTMTLEAGEIIEEGLEIWAIELDFIIN